MLKSIKDGDKTNVPIH